MAHLYKAVEWQGASGRWYVEDTSHLAGTAALWWTPVRLLNITPNEYILLLKNKFNANHFNYTAKTNVLIFSFDTQVEARKYKNWINAQARKLNYMCD